jgi:hypothetical protein
VRACVRACVRCRACAMAARGGVVWPRAEEVLRAGSMAVSAGQPRTCTHADANNPASQRMHSSATVHAHIVGGRAECRPLSQQRACA